MAGGAHGAGPIRHGSPRNATMTHPPRAGTGQEPPRLRIGNDVTAAFNRSVWCAPPTGWVTVQAGLLARGSLSLRPAFPVSQWPCRTLTRRLQLRGQPGSWSIAGPHPVPSFLPGVDRGTYTRDDDPPSPRAGSSAILPQACLVGACDAARRLSCDRHDRIVPHRLRAALARRPVSRGLADA